MNQPNNRANTRASCDAACGPTRTHGCTDSTLGSCSVLGVVRVRVFSILHSLSSLRSLVTRASWQHHGFGYGRSMIAQSGTTVVYTAPCTARLVASRGTRRAHRATHAAARPPRRRRRRHPRWARAGGDRGHNNRQTRRCRRLAGHLAGRRRRALPPPIAQVRAPVYTDSAPATISVSSVVITAWRCRLYLIVSLLIMSVALLVAESIAVMREACSLVMFSSRQP